MDDRIHRGAVVGYGTTLVPLGGDDGAWERLLEAARVVDGG